MDYTLTINIHAGAAHAQVTGTTLTGTTIDLAHWTADTPHAAVAAAAGHGWRTFTTNPDQPIPVQPVDMHRHAQDIIRAKQAAEAEVDRWTAAFHDLIATMPPPGDPLYVSATDIAALSGVKRQRIHAIRRAHTRSTPGTTPA